MASVYGNADITIVASRASSSVEGLLSSRDETCVVKAETDTSGQEIHSHLINRDYYDNYLSRVAESHAQPLAKRAWAIQERHLSRRKILFGEVQLYCECNRTTESEDTQLEIFHSPVEPSWDVSAWYNMVEQFTNCGITYESDTLPAICGIARTVADKTGYTYCAGIWLNQLCNSLLWYPEWNGSDVSTKLRRNTYVAPSFSWAASQGPISYRALSKGVMSGSIGEYVAHGQTLRAGSSDPYGGLEDAWIQLDAPLIKVLLQTEGVGPSIRLILQLQSRGKYVIPAIFDHHAPSIPPDTFVLLMYHDETRMQGLVLARTSVLRDCMAFRLIGISWAPYDDLQKVGWQGDIVNIDYVEREKEMKQFVTQAKEQSQTVMLV